MPRLTRQESHQQTRRKLLDAALAEILRQGLGQASIRAICDNAGFTLGAFYSNFRNKDELLLEILDIHSRREFESLGAMSAALDGLSTEEALARLSLWLEDLRTNGIFSSLSLEFELHASRNADFRAAYLACNERWHQEIARALQALFSSRGLAPGMDLALMAVGFRALWCGLSIDAAAPEASNAAQVVVAFLRALLAAAGPAMPDGGGVSDKGEI